MKAVAYMKPGDWAWIGLGVYVLVWDRFCPPGQLLSQRMDVYRAVEPVVTYSVFAYVVGHLTRKWPARVDPLTRLAIWLGK